MPSYRAPKGTEVSTVIAGEEYRVSFDKPVREVKDEALAEVLDRLADDPANAVRHSHADKKE